MNKSSKQQKILQLDPARVAEKYVAEVKVQVEGISTRIKVVGLIASHDKPSLAYARATQQKFDAIGIERPSRCSRRPIKKGTIALHTIGHHQNAG